MRELLLLLFGGIVFTQVVLKVVKRKFRSMPFLFLQIFHFPSGASSAVACSVRSWGSSPAEMERSLGFRMGFFDDDDDEWAVVVVKDLEKMGIVGNRKNCSVGMVVVVVVVLSSILRVLFLFLLQVTTNDGTTNDLCLSACLLIILRKKLILKIRYSKPFEYFITIHKR